MAGYFEIFKGTSDYRFRLRAGNHEIILQSEGYTQKAGAENGVASVQTNAPNEDRYDRKLARDGQYFFVLKAGNGEPIGNSEMYTTQAARNNGIRSVQENGPTTDVRDQT